MAGRIADDDIQALREQASIAMVVAEYTQLKRAGTRLKGLCPFHNEKTPSFTVDESRGVFHCFGCGQGGDTYGFLQQIEGLTFPEAVERLAHLTGFVLRYEERTPGQRRALGRKTRLTEAVEEAAAYFARQLGGDDGEPARRYLAGRGLGKHEATHFRLGWAPDAWDSLVRHLVDAGFDQREVLDAGLASEGKRGLIDRFRGRIIFPIIGQAGVIAFGGRIVPDLEPATGGRDATPPKYINSSESAVYRKSETLYALNWARPEIVRRQTALVVEGYMDVIGLHVAGIRYAVATCGTALTAGHFRQLERFVTRIVLALDADAAGYAAADRARALAEEAGVRDVVVLPLPPGKDPADLAAEGADAVEEALGRVQTAVEFQIAHLLRDADTSTPEGKIAAYRQTLPLLARLPDRFLRFTYVRDLVAPAVRLSADRIEHELDAAIAAGAGREATKPVPSDRVGDGGSGAVTRLGGVATPRDPQLVLEREVLRAALQNPTTLPGSWRNVTAEDFTAPASRVLFQALVEAPGHDLDAILSVLPDDDARARVRALALSDHTSTTDAAHARELVSRLRAAAVGREIARTSEELDGLNAEADPDANRTLLARLFELERRRRDLLEADEVQEQGRTAQGGASPT